MICDPPATFPPTPSTCPGLHDSGVQIQQTTTLLPAARSRASRSASRASTGRATGSTPCSRNRSRARRPARRPASSSRPRRSLATHGAPYSFAPFPPGPGSIIAISNNNGFLPATSNPIGAITYNRPPLSADFVSATGAQTATFLMHYADTVPPGGSVVYDWSYSQAATSGSLATLEQIERDRFGIPSITIGSPRNNSSDYEANVVRVQGQTLDSVGVTSLTVGGQGVAGRARRRVRRKRPT